MRAATGGHALSATWAPDVRHLARNVINLLDHFDEATGDSMTPPDTQPTHLSRTTWSLRPMAACTACRPS